MAVRRLAVLHHLHGTDRPGDGLQGDLQRTVRPLAGGVDEVHRQSGDQLGQVTVAMRRAVSARLTVGGRGDDLPDG